TVNQPLGELPTHPRSGAGTLGKAKVFVQIPASHIVERFRAVSPERKLTSVELEPFFAEARERVEKVVRNVIPTGELGSLEVSRIDVTGPLNEPNTGSDTSLRRVRPVWLVSAVGGVAATTLIFAASFGFWLASRRPAARPSTITRRHRLVTRASAGPAER